MREAGMEEEEGVEMGEMRTINKVERKKSNWEMGEWK